VALCPGSGGDLISAAVSSGGQVYITGDLKYHQALEAVDLGLTVIDAGHYGTEKPSVELLVETLERVVEGKVSVISIETEDPFKEDLL
jgi:putative NIF3 family GTP cyclohydrolase 1 type 2